ncbi:MAG TPA: hypothetical protein VLW65_21825 [Bryobacteraceae bacterium]|nr:hypothetical protein [Bryobacteraceae bacterium]
MATIFGANELFSAISERDQVWGDDIFTRQAQLGSASGMYEQLEPLSDIGAPMYDVPESGPAKPECRGLPLDEIEDLLPRSAAYRQAERFVLPPPVAIKGRPSTPLHTGHVAICAVSGMLNGAFGAGDGLHVAAWQSCGEYRPVARAASGGEISLAPRPE